METLDIKTITVSPTISTDKLIELFYKHYKKQEKFLLVMVEGYDVDIAPESIKRMAQAMNENSAAMVYADYKVNNQDGTLSNHPLASYQDGSIRDDFDFGPLFLLSLSAVLMFEPSARIMYSEYSQFSGLYAVRLSLHANYKYDSIVHVPEYLYISSEVDNRKSGEKQFDYVNPRNINVQKEREQICTSFLGHLQICLTQRDKLINPKEGAFPVEASVIIPVRDRAKTITDAVNSALSQEADFDFNVIVVDNHSTDGTTEILQQIAAKNSHVVHIIPLRRDLGIGGCWDLAVHSEQCGRYAIQLDSDDKYKDATTVAQIVDSFHREKCAMVIGSYELTDFDGNPLPPGLIDHKEWTPENGHNNALRINGLGAPRAFYTPVLREIGVPNVSYGEDYALGLRISREYRIGRIYHSLYLCRRWNGNSDANLNQERINTNNQYKDWLRTNEMHARHAIAISEPSAKYKANKAAIEALIAKQLEQWPLAAQNFASLNQLKTKVLQVGGADIQVLFNQARAISSGAKTDAASIAKRPCFLCEANRPTCQIATPILDGYSMLVNPYPIFSTHLTIVSNTHQPQRINVAEPDGSSRYLTLFDLCQKLPSMVIFYNGAKCGASAPDHLHFQAAGAEEFDDLFSPLCKLPYKRYKIEGVSRDHIEAAISDVMSEIAKLPANFNEEEPQVNLFMKVASRGGFLDTVNVVIVPRRAHRPSCYGTGNGQLMISPGAVDVAGKIITARQEDFDNLDASKLTQILSETTYFNEWDSPSTVCEF
jgi:glycosyltransferase involved in cell wall biosynthesis